MAGFCKEHKNMYVGGYCIMCANQKAAGPSKKHNHYFADVSDLDYIDLYEVCERFGINDASGCTQHAAKKIIFAGKRGIKDQMQDVNEAINSLERLKEILKKRELNANN